MFIFSLANFVGNLGRSPSCETSCSCPSPFAFTTYWFQRGVQGQKLRRTYYCTQWSRNYWLLVALVSQGHPLPRGWSLNWVELRMVICFEFINFWARVKVRYFADEVSVGVQTPQAASRNPYLGKWLVFKLMRKQKHLGMTFYALTSSKQWHRKLNGWHPQSSAQGQHLSVSPPL